MRYRRLGERGQEVPVACTDRGLVDLRPLTADVDGAFLSGVEPQGQWDKGKSCETFNPVGPDLVTPDEIADVQRLGLGAAVNGVPRQSSSTAEMIFGVHHLIWYLSQFMVLNPGDLVNTGTPAGVALGATGRPYLRPGDVVELWVERLGTARQRFEAAP